MFPFTKKKKLAPLSRSGSPERSPDVMVIATPVQNPMLASPSKLLLSRENRRGGKRLVNTATVYNQFEEMKRSQSVQGYQETGSNPTSPNPNRPKPRLTIAYVIILSAVTATLAAFACLHLFFGGQRLVYDVHPRGMWTERALRGPNTRIQNLPNLPLRVDTWPTQENQGDAIMVSVKVYLLGKESNFNLGPWTSTWGTEWERVKTSGSKMKTSIHGLTEGLHGALSSLSLIRDSASDLGEWAATKSGQMKMRSSKWGYKFMQSGQKSVHGLAQGVLSSLALMHQGASNVGQRVGSGWVQMQTRTRLSLTPLSNLHAAFSKLANNIDWKGASMAEWAGSKWGQMQKWGSKLMKSGQTGMRSLHRGAFNMASNLAHRAGPKWEQMKIWGQTSMSSLHQGASGVFSNIARRGSELHQMGMRLRESASNISSMGSNIASNIARNMGSSMGSMGDWAVRAGSEWASQASKWESRWESQWDSMSTDMRTEWENTRSDMHSLIAEDAF